MAPRKDSRLYWLLLSCFAVLLLASGLAFLFIRKPGLSPSILGQANATGAYQIEGPNEVSINTPFQINFIADSDNKNVNAVSLQATFDPAKITILNIDTSQSFCQFYPENKFSNDRGTISISCGAPNPGYKGKSPIAIVNFYAKNIGETQINITDKSLILLNDGKGTNIFKEAISKSIIVINNI